MDLTATLQSLAAFAAQIRGSLSVFAVLAGIVMFASAARALLKTQGYDQGPNLLGVGVRMFIGAALFQLARSIEDTRTGLLAGAGQEVRVMMGTVMPAGAGGGFWQLLLSTCLVWIATIGCIGMFRGFLLWNKAGAGDSQGGQGGDFFWRGLWHIVGGAIAINIGT